MCRRSVTSRYLTQGAMCLAALVSGYSGNGQPFTNTVIVQENQKAGSTNWLLTNPAPLGGIEGYASLTSVNRGGQISFFVNTTNSSYILEVFRIGWYAGAGARQVFGPLTVPGSVQTIPTPDPVSGFLECNWTNPYTLSIPATPNDPTDWASGVYVARLTGSQDGYQSYIIFAVRDDQRATDLLAQLSFTTYEAYNAWDGPSPYGGPSLYHFNAIHNAWKVSFNRPFGNQQHRNWNGTGNFFASLEEGGAAWECNLVRWMEREGYDVSYCTGVDVHVDTNLLSNHKAFLSMGHDEYWSYPMRWNVEAARDRGVNLGFLSANTCYWQIRFEPSASNGAPNRTIVCYKQTPGSTNSIDPVSTTSSNYLTTTQFRYPPVNNIESSFVGVSGDFWPLNNDLVVNDPTHWAFAGTGVKAGQLLVGLLGYEVSSANWASPSNIQLACQSPYRYNSSLSTSYSHVTSYAVPSGATVVTSGSMQWSWGLDDFNVPAFRQSRQSPLAQQITRNIMARLLNQPTPSPTLFFRTDFITAGNWPPTYGSEGYVLPGYSTNLPSYASVDPGAAIVTNCPVSNPDTNSLLQPSGSNRFLAGWSSATNFTLDLNLTDSSNHLAAFYFWDWNNTGRTQMVEVLDAQTTNLLDRQIVSSFKGGQWWVWQVQGHIQFRVTCLAGPDCLLNAFMLGSGAQVQFLGQDSLTQGNWQPYYGADGSYIAGDPVQPGTYASLSVLNSTVRWNSDNYLGGNFTFTNWSLDTSDPRAPAPYPNTRRVFAAWMATANFINTVDVNANDNAWHQFAVYCVDPDNLGRKQFFALVDPANSSVLDTQVLTNFSGGKYLVWNLRGHVQLRFQSLNQQSAVVSSMFLDPPNQPLVMAVPTLLPDGSLQISVAAPPQQSIELLATTNLANSWMLLLSNPPGQSVFIVQDPTNYPQRFYRATILP